MKRFVPVVRVVALALALFVGFSLNQPSTPQASAYPTALENLSAPTALSVGCVFQTVCYSPGPQGFCGPGTDPDLGCEETPGYGCLDCIL